MSGYLQLLVIFFAAINPPAVALARSRRTDKDAEALPAAIVAAGALVAFAAYAILAMSADSLLDALDIEPESFRVAAGVVLATAGVWAVWHGGAPHSGPWLGWAAAAFPIGAPLLASAAGLMATVSYAADEGARETLGAIVLPLGTAAVLLYFGTKRWMPAADALARILGALLVAIAAGLVVGGVRDI